MHSDPTIRNAARRTAVELRAGVLTAVIDGLCDTLRAALVAGEAHDIDLQVMYTQYLRELVSGPAFLIPAGARLRASVSDGGRTEGHSRSDPVRPWSVAGGVEHPADARIPDDAEYWARGLEERSESEDLCRLLLLWVYGCASACGLDIARYYDERFAQ